MSLKQYIDDIVSYIQQEHQIEEVNPKALLIETGIIDSFGIVTLITFIEDKYKLALSKEDLTPENFASIYTIAQLIKRKIEKS